VDDAAHSIVSVFVGTSLDGFLARIDGDIDWMQGFDGPEQMSDYGYDSFMARIDAIVMGRKTFEKVASFEIWPYQQKPVVVLTTNKTMQIPQKLSGKKVETMAGEPGDIVDRLAKRGLFRLYVDGGQTIQRFLGAGLVDEMIISQLPILIGTGIPLFGPLPADIRLKHVETRTFPGGMVQSVYKVKRSPG
jgi:dihydrofolate reductase